MRSTVWYQFGNPIKIKFRKHFCNACGKPLEMKKHCKMVNSKDNEAKYYDFSAGETSTIVGNVNFIHKIFYCPNCNLEIEPVTQLSIEDIDIIINKVEKHVKKKSKDLIIKKYFETNEDIVVNEVTNIADIKNLFLIALLNNIEISVFKVPLLQKNCWERPYYFKLSKRKLIKAIKKEII